MSIDRKIVSDKFIKLINEEYNGEFKELLLYLTPIIFENNPADNCNFFGSERIRDLVPDRRKMRKDSQYGMAIGNLTSQAGSNLNLSDFDIFVTEKLGLIHYVRYVDDIIILSRDKKKLENALPLIIEELKKTHQSINLKKTIIDTAYHGIKFLGKITYPYNYQKPSKTLIKRVYNKAKTIKIKSKESLLASTNSQIGTLKRYNCRKLIIQYASLLPDNVKEIVEYDKELMKFKYYRLY